MKPKLKWLLLFPSCVLVFATSMEDVWVELQAPRFVVHGHSAVFRCEHNVGSQTLYKVVFFKSGQRITQYIQGRDPPFERYNFTGADIDLMKITPTSITLEKMDFKASGPYACEITLEIPLYSKASKIHEVNVIVRQKYRPKIKIKHKKLSPNDDLEATCQSGPAHPAPHLTWLINQVKVDERLTIPHGTMNVHRDHHGMTLSLTNSSLRFPLASLQLYPNPTVDITCLSTIPSYASNGDGFADIQNNTVTVNVIRLGPASVPTQLPVKILSAEQSRSSPLTLDIQIVFGRNTDSAKLFHSLDIQTKKDEARRFVRTGGMSTCLVHIVLLCYTYLLHILYYVTHVQVVCDSLFRCIC